MQALIAAHFPAARVEGVYGNATVMEYYKENKRSVNSLTKLDIFRLQHRLPAFLLRAPYTLLNNLNRFLLLGKTDAATLNIRYDDFYQHRLKEDCLDYFVTAEKPGDIPACK